MALLMARPMEWLKARRMAQMTALLQAAGWERRMALLMARPMAWWMAT